MSRAHLVVYAVLLISLLSTLLYLVGLLGFELQVVSAGSLTLHGDAFLVYEVEFLFPFMLLGILSTIVLIVQLLRREVASVKTASAS